MIITQRVPVSTGDTSKPLNKRDRLLEFDNNGVRFMFDTAFGWCYAAGTAAANKAVRDMAEREDSMLKVRATQTVPLVGGGLDLSGNTLPGQYIEIPASVWADLFAEQKFLIAFYFKSPTEADWSTEASPKAMFQGSGSSQSYVSDPDIGFMGYSATVKALTARRQKGINSVDSLTISPAAGPGYGLVTQFAMWRNGTEFAARMKTANGTIKQTMAAGAKNTANFSTSLGGMGLPFGFWTSPGLTAGEQAASNFKLYRGFVENLDRSGRDAGAVLDADWQRTIDRNVFA